MKQTCYDWFCKGIGDLESDTQLQLFQKEILKLDLNKLTPTGMPPDQCDFRFGLFFRFSFRFLFANYFFVLVSF